MASKEDMSASNGALASEEQRNFFTEIIYPWPEVTQDGKLRTVEFLDAATAIVDFFGLIGRAYSPVKSDVSQNIEKLRKTHATNPEKYEYLNDMILHEVECGKCYATEALLWLKRALEYVEVFLSCVVEDHDAGKNTENLVPFCQRAYDETLKQYHGWMLQKLYKILSQAFPWRRDLMKTLARGREGMDAVVIRHMREFLQGLHANVNAIVIFYNTHNLNSDKKV